MDTQQRKLTFQGLHQSRAIFSGPWNDDQTMAGERLYILLHGYCESAEVIFRRLGRHLNSTDSIVAFDGLYPLPKTLPLESFVKEGDSPEKFLQGFAWYFYDQRADQFLIDYQVPVNSLCHALESLNPENKPVSIVGYSQGGYLAPFLALEYRPTTHVLGINCSFRFDLLKENYSEIPFRIDQIQGREDQIIDTKLCHRRFYELKDHYECDGEFEWIDEGTHWLDATTRKKAISIIQP